MKISKYYNLISYSFFYSFIGVLIFIVTDGQPFQTMNGIGLNKVLDFIIQSEEIRKINYYLIKADEKFFFFYFAVYFLFIIIFLFLNFNKIILSKNRLFKFNNVDFKINLKNKNRLYFYIALAAGLGLFFGTGYYKNTFFIFSIICLF